MSQIAVEPWRHAWQSRGLLCAVLCCAERSHGLLFAVVSAGARGSCTWWGMLAEGAVAQPLLVGSTSIACLG